MTNIEKKERKKKHKFVYQLSRTTYSNEILIPNSRTFNLMSTPPSNICIIQFWIPKKKNWNTKSSSEGIEPEWAKTLIIDRILICYLKLDRVAEGTLNQSEVHREPLDSTNDKLVLLFGHRIWVYGPCILEAGNREWEKEWAKKFGGNFERWNLN